VILPRTLPRICTAISTESSTSIDSSNAGHGAYASDSAWPKVDPAMLVEDAVEIVVQILGKVRGKVTVPAGADDKTLEAAALGDEKIKSQLEGKTVKKVIVVPGRLVNIVAS
jgi:leucyl-tRNA synthetase